MEGFTKLHMSKPIKCYDLAKKRQDASVQLNKRRKDNRTENFNLRRNIPEDIKPKAQDHIVDKKCFERKLALKKFQSDRDIKRNKENERKKPPFVVGIPHHGSTPLLKNIQNVEADNCNRGQNNDKIISKRVTRAMTKLPQTRTLFGEKHDKVKPSTKIQCDKVKAHTKIQCFEKNKPNKTSQCVQPVMKFPLNNVVSFHPPRILSMKKLTSPHTPKVLKRSTRKNGEAPKPLNKIRCNLYGGQNNTTKQKKLSKNSEELPRTTLPLVENTGRTRNSADIDKNVNKESKEDIKYKIVPKEAIENADNQVTNSDQFNIDNLQANNACGARPNDEVVPDAFGAKFQRNRVEKETTYLMGLVEEWEGISESSVDLPSDTLDEIDSVIGQTRLLIKDKFNQFHRLIKDYEVNNGNQVITTEDLNGFWDMMYLQVINLTKRYDELEKLKNNKWVKESPVIKKKRGRPSKTKPKIEASSTMKDFIKARRTAAAALSSDLSPDQKITKNKPKFSLRPSILVVKDVVNDLKIDVSKTPLRRSERKQNLTLDKDDGKTPTETEVEECMQSSKLLRSGKKQSRKSAILNSSAITPDSSTTARRQQLV